MKKLLAATLLAAAACTTTSASAGCVDDLVPDAISIDGNIVERNPDGSITIHPPTVQLAPVVLRAVVFVNCVV